MKTIDKIKNAVQEYITDDQQNVELYNKVYQAIKKHDGEKISKRIATTVEKTLGDSYQVYYSTQYGMFTLRIRKSGEISDKWKDFILGYDSNPIFRLVTLDPNKTENARYIERGFDNFNACFGSAASKRIKENSKILKSDKLQKLAELHDQKIEIENQISKLNLEHYEFPAYFSVQKVLSIAF